jgi:hypothetical protein
VPLGREMVDKKIDVVVLGLNEKHIDFEPKVYITAYPTPYAVRRLLLYR